MDTLFGLPVGGLATGVVIALAVALAVLATLALRNRVFAKLALRSAVRGGGRTALIVAGLMLATTIITSALVTGDTMSTTMRSSVIQTLGAADETVAIEGAEGEGFADVVELGGATDQQYLDQAVVPEILATADGIDQVDAASPSISEPVAVRDDTTRRNEPNVMLFAADPARYAAFSPIVGDGGAVSLGDLGPGEAYLNEDAAEELDARRGDEVTVFAGLREASLRVIDVVEADGVGTDDSALLLPLADGQAVLGREGQVENVLVSNRGDETSGAARTDAVVAALRPAMDDLGLDVDPVKQDGLEDADLQGNAFMSLFTTFGTFSIVAGVLLIFLIFLMLASERRPELGVARAVGTRRGHLVQMFVFEGVAYDLVAAAVGVLVGVLVAFGMVTVVGRAFGSGFEIVRSVRLRSLAVGYGSGVLLTLVVVTISAWRVSVLNIVTAVRNLPEPVARRGGRRRWVLAAAVALLGVLMVTSGASSSDAVPFMLGVSLVMLAIVVVLRSLGVPARAVYTAGGLALVVWWLLPFEVMDALIGDPTMDFSIWIIGGLMVVLGATWVVINNADLILRFGMTAAGRLRSLSPVVKMAGAYPLRSRFRTAVTLAMFTLVVFTLVTGAAISYSFTSALDDVERFGGGFDIRAGTSPVSPVGDMHGAIEGSPELDGEDFEAVGSQSFLPVEARQVDGPASSEAYAVRGLDREFLSETTYGFGTMARGYDSDEQVWDALAQNPGYAVVDSFVVPRREQFGFAVLPDFQLSGFYAEDESFDPVTVQVQHPQTGRDLDLTVIAVLEDSAPFEMAGITTSAATLQPFGDVVQPTTHYFRLAPGVDTEATADLLESRFLENGMEAETMAAALDDVVGGNLTFQRLVMGFMGLGLLVGVAALGVISARAVVERRQQIGVLRAVGFRPEMVRLSFLLEAGVLAGTAIVVGAGLGLVMSYNVVADSAQQPAWEGLELTVPWLSFAVIFAVVFLAALAATYAPARRASRIYPAEALRYE